MNEHLFPLQLTPFERYLIADDRRDYPMTFVMQFTFEGAVNRSQWEAALQDALGRHPLLTSLIQKRRHWTSSSLQPPIHWLTREDEIDLKDGEYLDISREPGLRIWMLGDNHHFRLTCQFHHACCDGIGALQFLGDWFAAYDAKCAGTDVDWTPLDSHKLSQRGNARWKINTSAPVSRWQALTSLLREVYKFSTRRLKPLRKSVANGKPSFPGMLHHTYSQQLTGQLREKSRKCAVTLNDLMLRDLFRTLATWNGESSESKRWLQINMPTNLRGREDRHLPAANVIGYAFIARQARDCREPKFLLESISTETTAIRRGNLGQFFLDALSRIVRIPGGLSWFVSPRSCCATTVLSSLGDLKSHFRHKLPLVDGYFKTGNLTIEQFLAIPPLRPLTRAVFLTTSYAGELTIIMRADSHTMDDSDAQTLLKAFIRSLERSAVAEENGIAINQDICQQ